jgi:DNA modification methylase
VEINKVIKGNCLDLFKDVSDNSVDMVITDPPYNISKENDNRDRSKLNSPIMRRESPLRYDFGEWDNKSREEFIDFTKQWLKECCRVLKDGGTIISFFNKEDISLLGWEAKQFGIRTRTIFTWCKSNPVPSFRKVNYLSATEYLWIGSKGTKSWTFNFKQQKEMKNFMVTSNKSVYGETEHPTEKPKELIKYLIEVHSNQGDTILDCFGGSGTTAICCKELGRNFILFEALEEYCKMAEKRLSQNVLLPLAVKQEGGNGSPPTNKFVGIRA